MVKINADKRRATNLLKKVFKMYGLRVAFYVLLKINNRLMSKLFGLCQGLTMRIK